MNKSSTTRHGGFTLVELLIVCVVIAVLAVVAIVSYQNIQERAARTAIFKDLKSAAEQLGLSYVRSPEAFSSLDTIGDDMQSSGDVILRLDSGYTGPYYEHLSPVQTGVLFYDICEELIANPAYSEIHSADGAQTQSVVMNCSHSISTGSLQITGWDTKSWGTPVTRETIQNYINSVPYNNWWVDKQDVIRGFYIAMIQRFEARGGKFPITSFWDPWANQWSGTPKENLPEPALPPGSASGAFCVEAYHAAYPSNIYRITEKDKIETGPC